MASCGSSTGNAQASRVLKMSSHSARVRVLNTSANRSLVSFHDDVSFWSGLATLGGGVAITLAPHVALTAEVEGMLIWPVVSVRVSDTDVVKIDRPILFSDLGLLATF